MTDVISERRDRFVLAGLALLWLIALAFGRPLALPDEGRYVGVAWEMLRSGDWMTPQLDGMPYFHKPPLFYWISAAALKLAGVNVWAARIAPMLGLAILIGISAWFVARWSGKRAARLNATLLLAHPLLFLGGQYANLDMLVASLITASILLLADSLLRAERGESRRSVLLAAWAAAALGVLAKGLIGFVIPAMVIGLWLVSARRWRLLGGLFSPWGIGAFVVLALPWFASMEYRHPGFLDYMFVYQHFRRFAAGGFNNVQPFWFFPALLAILSLPWFPWLARTVRTRPGTGHGEPARLSLRSLMWIWLLAVLVFFSLPASKLVGYIFPAVPPLVWLLVDAYLAVPQRGPGASRWWYGGTIAIAIAASVLLIWLAFKPPHTNDTLARELSARLAPDDEIFMLGGYDFDVPIYLELKRPVHVVDEWDDPQLAAQDNWRKELHDAGGFAPDVAKSVLVRPEQLGQALCHASTNWLIAASGRDPEHWIPDRATLTYRGPVRSLWRVGRDAAQCAQASGRERNAQ